MNRTAAAEVSSPHADLLLESRVIPGCHGASPNLRQQREPSHGSRQPDAAQCLVHHLPLASLFEEMRPSLARNAVILAPPTALGDAPFRADVAQSLEAVQHRIEHAVSPLQLPP